MRRIYKYRLEITDYQRIELPVGARLLHVGEQSGELYLWAMVWTTNNTEPCQVRIFGTGNPVYSGDLGEFVGTVQMSSGLVWHVFAEPAP